MSIITETVDRFLSIDAQIKTLQADQKILKAAILASGEEQIDGSEQAVKIVHWTLKSKEVQEEMGEDWWVSRCKQGMTTSVRICKKDA